jgi:hypothetical protein
MIKTVKRTDSHNLQDLKETVSFFNNTIGNINLLKTSLNTKIQFIERNFQLKKRNELENEIYKKNISEQLKRLDKNSLISTDKKTVNLTLWQRIMKVLGMN